jgi:hypothetical protein
VFGRIYEQVGESGAAARAYQKVTPKPGAENDPLSPATLAKRRLQILATP